MSFIAYIPSSQAGWSCTVALQVLLPSTCLSADRLRCGLDDQLGSPCSTSGASISMLQLVQTTGIHFTLRAAVLLSLLRRIQRFSTSSHPETLVACYAAA